LKGKHLSSCSLVVLQIELLKVVADSGFVSEFRRRLLRWPAKQPDKSCYM
jgi:hypothetical protein